MATKKKQASVQQFSLPIALSNDRGGTLSEKPQKTNGILAGANRRDGAGRSVVLSSPTFFCRLTPPGPTPVYETYWKFAKTRQDVFFQRLAGNLSAPSDPIIQRHRFTNAYRASDRVSQYLIRHVLYGASWSPVDLVFRLLIFKFFNKIETWEALERELGVICWSAYDFKRYDRCLSRIMDLGQTIYSAAYITPSGRTAFGFERKHRNHLKVIEAIVDARVPDQISERATLKSVFQLLLEFPCLGPFIAYQFSIDLNYSSLLDFSENDFVEPGPGALDGIAKCFSDLGDLTPADTIRYMVDIQEQAFDRFAPGFQTLWGRPLHLIDCQNLFCEVGKYARVAHPKVEGLSNRTRIKQIYRPSPHGFERPWFPPKWGLNELIALDPRFQSARI